MNFKCVFLILSIFFAFFSCEKDDQLQPVENGQVLEEFFTIRTMDSSISDPLLQEILQQLSKEGQVLPNDDTEYTSTKEVLPLLQADIQQNGISQVYDVGTPYWGNGLAEPRLDRNNYYYPLIHLGHISGVLFVSKSENILSVKAIPKSYIIAADERSFLTSAFAHFQTVLTGHTEISPRLLISESDLHNYDINDMTKCEPGFSYFRRGRCHVYIFVNSDCVETVNVYCDEVLGGTPDAGDDHDDCNCDIDPFEDGGDLSGNTIPIGSQPDENPLGSGLATPSEIEDLLACNPGDFDNNIRPAFIDMFSPPCNNFEIWLDDNGIIELRCPSIPSYAFNTGLAILELTCQGIE